MATEKIKIETISFKNNWFNIKDDKGRDISVGIAEKTTGKPINQILKAALEGATPGSVVEMELREWQGKYFGNEPKVGGGTKSFAPKDKSFDAAIAAAQTVGSMLGGRPEPLTPKAFDVLFEHVHQQIMSKATK